jgi:hypothetical protein
MYVLLKINIRKSDGKIGQVDIEKYDLPDHLPVGLIFCFYQLNKKGLKKKVPISIVRDGTFMIKRCLTIFFVFNFAFTSKFSKVENSSSTNCFLLISTFVKQASLQGRYAQHLQNLTFYE